MAASNSLCEENPQKIRESERNLDDEDGIKAVP
jgi:hypothetical protein